MGMILKMLYHARQKQVALQTPLAIGAGGRTL